MAEHEFVRVAKASEIGVGLLKTVNLRGENVVIANVGGKYYAIGAICNHAGWDLSEGYLEGKVITCAGHGAKWNLETGQADFDVPLKPEPIYEVKVEGTDLYLRRRSRLS